MTQLYVEVDRLANCVSWPQASLTHVFKVTEPDRLISS